MHISQGYLTTSDRCRIHYDHYENHHQNLIVIAHGFFNSKESKLLQDLARNLNKDYDVLVFDFRGHGKSSCLYTWTAKESIDLETVLKHFKERYRKIGVIGFSLGAATSLITAARTDLIDSLVAISAPSEFGKIEYKFWNLDFENDIHFNLIGEGRVGKGVRPGPFWLRKQKPITLVSKIIIPTLYVHGDNDWIINHQHSERLFKETLHKKKLVIIKEGPHAEYLIRKNKEEVLKVIREWFKETL